MPLTDVVPEKELSLTTVLMRGLGFGWQSLWLWAAIVAVVVCTIQARLPGLNPKSL